MKLFPLLALFAIGSPALANGVLNSVTIHSRTGHTYVFHRQHMNCQDPGNGNLFRCEIHGVQTDLTGRQQQWSEWSNVYYKKDGTWQKDPSCMKGNYGPKRKIVCQAVWKINGH